MRACELSGTTGKGQICTSPTSCQAGLLCIGSGTSGLCEMFCDMDSDCPGAICAIQLSNGMGGAIPDVTLCTDACDLQTSSGCTSGASCQIGQDATGQMRFYTYCTVAGTGTQGQPCTTASDCAPTYGCFSTMTCAQYCDPSDINACGGQGCGALTDTTTMMPVTINGEPVGACP